MKDWAKRIKVLADKAGLTNSELGRACNPTVKPNSVAQWFGEIKDKAPTGDIKGSNLVDVARKLGVTAEFIMTGRESQSVSIDPETIAHAFVAVEKALRKRGIKYDAAQVPELLVFAYRERMELPPGRDPVVFGTFDRTVSRELARIMPNEREASGPNASAGGREDAQAAPAKAKNRGRGG